MSARPRASDFRHALPYWACPTTRRRATPAARSGPPGQILVAALGRSSQSPIVVLAVELVCGVGSAGQGLEERLLGQLVVGAGGGRCGAGVDAQPSRRFSARCCGPRAYRCKQWRSEAAFYAGNALTTTLPGGPVLSATFIYRQQRIWGASPVVASWQLVMSGAHAGGRAWRCSGLGGAFHAGRRAKPAVA